MHGDTNSMMIIIIEHIVLGPRGNAKINFFDSDKNEYILRSFSTLGGPMRVMKMHFFVDWALFDPIHLESIFPQLSLYDSTNVFKNHNFMPSSESSKTAWDLIPSPGPREILGILFSNQGKKVKSWHAMSGSSESPKSIFTSSLILLKSALRRSSFVIK